MTDPPASPQDPAYRAIGRFMVEFSRVISVMQTEIAVVVGNISPGLPVRALQVAVAQVTSASELANMFFGVCTTSSAAINSAMPRTLRLGPTTAIHARAANPLTLLVLVRARVSLTFSALLESVRGKS